MFALTICGLLLLGFSNFSNLKFHDLDYPICEGHLYMQGKTLIKDSFAQYFVHCEIETSAKFLLHCSSIYSIFNLGQFNPACILPYLFRSGFWHQSILRMHKKEEIFTSFLKLSLSGQCPHTIFQVCFFCNWTYEWVFPWNLHFRRYQWYHNGSLKSLLWIFLFIQLSLAIVEEPSLPGFSIPYYVRAVLFLLLPNQAAFCFKFEGFSLSRWPFQLSACVWPFTCSVSSRCGLSQKGKSSGKTPNILWFLLLAL